jgi:hypothetical protein
MTIEDYNFVSPALPFYYVLVIFSAVILESIVSLDLSDQFFTLRIEIFQLLENASVPINKFCASPLL